MRYLISIMILKSKIWQKRHCVIHLQFYCFIYISISYSSRYNFYKKAIKIIDIRQGWANLLVGGPHYWVMNYQRAASFKIKRIQSRFKCKCLFIYLFIYLIHLFIYLFIYLLEVPAGYTELYSRPHAARGPQFVHPDYSSKKLGKNCFVDDLKENKSINIYTHTQIYYIYIHIYIYIYIYIYGHGLGSHVSFSR